VGVTTFRWTSRHAMVLGSIVYRMRFGVRSVDVSTMQAAGVMMLWLSPIPSALEDWNAQSGDEKLCHRASHEKCILF
jgi:hypothetical protein